MNISIIIPVYNGEKTLKELYYKIKNTLAGNISYELIFVYDHGKDNSWEIIKGFAQEDKDHIRGYHFNKNYGQQLATFYGLKKASGNILITMDEDNQHNPEYIPEMIKKLECEQLDYVYGKFRKISRPFSRAFLSLILKRMLCFMIPSLPDEYSSYRVIRKELANKALNENSHFSFLDAELGKLSTNYGNLFIDQRKKSDRKSSYTINRLLKQLFDVLFKYSSLFRLIYNTSLVLVLISSIITCCLTMSYSVHLISICIFFFLISSIMILIMINSYNRINSKSDPFVTECINQII